MKNFDELARKIKEGKAGIAPKTEGIATLYDVSSIELNGNFITIHGTLTCGTPSICSMTMTVVSFERYYEIVEY